MSKRQSLIKTPSGDIVNSYSDLAIAALEIPRSRSSLPNATWKEGWYPCYTTPVTSDLSDSDYVNVHYVGWDKKYDEIKHVNDLRQLGQEKESPFITDLKIQIKENLTQSTKADSHVTLNIKVTDEQFDCLSNHGLVQKVTKSKMIYAVQDRTNFERILGSGWDYRVLNEHGDCVFIKTSTVRFYKKQPKPLEDFIVFPDRCERYQIQRPQVVRFSFVKVPGNKSLFPTLLNAALL